MAKQRLYILGVGPGDPELLTVKAVRLIREADIVFAPVNRGKHRSYDICSEYVDTDKMIFLDIPMTSMSEDRYAKEGEMINSQLTQYTANSDFVSAVYLCLGDATIYSSAFKLLPYLNAEVECEWIAGIPSFLQGFNQLILPLVSTSERFLLVDEWNEETRTLLENIDSLALLKAHRDPVRIFAELREAGFTPYLLSHLGMPDEKVYQEICEEDEIPYLSLILARKME